ncbi:hypothetical protein EHP00_1364 [Ecytonucleospora hepatopenaei]|uniref:Uncharacterized protein n=1 Tax=Ecytonucleospora hepatopenaei TaxID=646526 RepID=A0A1W0E2Y4_9MICR|nr:hypothetical protein EHP00_1364 [Ecytonucleospora hepatopenaei]
MLQNKLKKIIGDYGDTFYITKISMFFVNIAKMLLNVNQILKFYVILIAKNTIKTYLLILVLIMILLKKLKF